MSSDIPTLESFLFTENKEEFLSKLVYGTDAYFFFTLTHALNQQGAKLTPQQITSLNSFRETNSYDANNVYIRHLLL